MVAEIKMRVVGRCAGDRREDSESKRCGAGGVVLQGGHGRAPFLLLAPEPEKARNLEKDRPEIRPREAAMR